MNVQIQNEGGENLLDITIVLYMYRPGIWWLASPWETWDFSSFLRNISITAGLTQVL